ncbi:MAG: outer membrane protein transport protein [Chloroherpetonaceae bacterium]|nr:outer membrane protein transport protein [Chloroherpetonaceae bacterium]
MLFPRKTNASSNNLFLQPLLIVILLLSAHALRAQNELDALRFSEKPLAVHSRALGMGSAYSAVSEDFGAMQFNPAGLGQIKRFELMLALENYGFSSNASYLGNTQTSSATQTLPSALGLIIPIPTFQGSFVIAFGFQRSNNFTGTQTADAFNATGSILNSFSNLNPIFDSNFNLQIEDYGGLAWSTYLFDLVGGRYVNEGTSNRVQQNSKINETGGTNLYNAGFSLEIAPALFVGLTLNYYNGNYTFNRTYNETDNTNAVWGFQSLSLVDNFTTQISGWGVKGGFLYRLDENLRFSFTVESPYLYSLSDRFSSELQSNYDFRRVPVFRNGVLFDSTNSSQDRFEGSFDYTLRTPFVFGLGFSYEESWMTLAADLRYTNHKELSYSQDNSPLDDINTVIQNQLSASYGLAIGLEIRPSEIPFRFRGGYGFDTSPFQFKLSNPNQNSDFGDARQRFSLGAGIILRKTLTLDFAYVYQWQTVENRFYSGSPIISDKVTQSFLSLTASFRF